MPALNAMMERTCFVDAPHCLRTGIHFDLYLGMSCLALITCFRLQIVPSNDVPLMLFGAWHVGTTGLAAAAACMVRPPIKPAEEYKVEIKLCLTDVTKKRSCQIRHISILVWRDVGNVLSLDRAAFVRQGTSGYDCTDVFAAIYLCKRLAGYVEVGIPSRRMRPSRFCSVFRHGRDLTGFVILVEMFPFCIKPWQH